MLLFGPPCIPRNYAISLRFKGGPNAKQHSPMAEVRFYGNGPL